MKVQDVADALAKIAPPSLAADWDNVGLLVGSSTDDANRVMLCIDLTEKVLAEAIRAKVQMVMAYHPIIFKPISKLTAEAAPVVYSAARAGISVYSMHTALDAAPGGTNDVLAELLGLVDTHPIEPIRQDDKCKIVTFTPPHDLGDVARAAFAAGAGQIGHYYDCAYFGHGIGSFCGEPGTNPTIGVPGKHETAEELRLEIIAPMSAAAAVCGAIRRAHSYEEPAIDVYPLAIFPDSLGYGSVGRLARPVTETALVNRIKRATGLKKVLIAKPPKRKSTSAGPKVRTAACVAGSWGSLWKPAAKEGATFFLTGEMRHHDALAAAGAGVTVVCLGHSNSERMTLARVAEKLRRMLKGVKVTQARADVDPFEIV